MTLRVITLNLNSFSIKGYHLPCRISAKSQWVDMYNTCCSDLKTNSLNQGSANFCKYFMIANTLCFVGHTASVKTTQLCPCSTKAVTDNISGAHKTSPWRLRVARRPVCQHGVWDASAQCLTAPLVLSLFLAITANKCNLLLPLQPTHHSIIPNFQITQNDLKCCRRRFWGHSTPNTQIIDALSSTLVLDHRR